MINENEQTTIDSTDISPKNFRFNPKIGTSLRDRLRDFADTLIRRPIYKVMYANKFLKAT